MTETLMKRTDYCGSLRLADAGREVVLCGWVQRSRDHGVTAKGWFRSYLTPRWMRTLLPRLKLRAANMCSRCAVLSGRGRKIRLTPIWQRARSKCFVTK